MDKKIIQERIADAVAARGCFIVEVGLSKDNDVTVTIESAESMVSMEDCVAVSERFQEIFDRDEEDYSLTVTSAGLDQPFKVLRQYLKAVGSRVVVHMEDGKKITGTLLAANEESITLAWAGRESVDGRKRPVNHEECLPFARIKSAARHIEFK